MLIDGDRVATLNRLSARRKGDGRIISYRLAHFMRFRDGKVVENCRSSTVSTRSNRCSAIRLPRKNRW